MSIKDIINGDTAEIVVNSMSLSGDDASDLKEKAVELLDKGIKKIHLNLSRPEYIDSSGIGKLLFMNKKIEKIGGEFKITAINKSLFNFLESLAVTKVMDVTEP